MGPFWVEKIGLQDRRQRTIWVLKSTRTRDLGLKIDETRDLGLKIDENARFEFEDRRDARFGGLGLQRFWVSN